MTSGTAQLASNPVGHEAPKRSRLVKAGGSAISVLLLTIGHHLYGASVYDTPWRAHVAHHAMVGIILILVTVVIAWKWNGTRIGREALWLFTVVTVLFPIAWIGLFEGGYNHVVKNALYFGGLSRERLLALFPPPRYELPNDLVFEVTGVLQFFVALQTVRATYRVVRDTKRIVTLGQAVSVMLAAALTAAPFAFGAAKTDLYGAAGVQQVRGRPEAPPFQLRTVDGRSIDSAALQGKVVLVNFWATWCKPCKDEMPAMQRLQQQVAHRDFMLLAITTDSQREAIAEFARTLGLSFPLLLDESKETSGAFGVRGLPTSVLIGRDGRIVGRALGPRPWDEAPAVTLVRELLK
jgi:peroxiredoxin